MNTCSCTSLIQFNSTDTVSTCDLIECRHQCTDCQFARGSDRNGLLYGDSRAKASACVDGEPIRAWECHHRLHDCRSEAQQVRPPVGVCEITHSFATRGPTPPRRSIHTRTKPADYLLHMAQHIQPEKHTCVPMHQPAHFFHCR